LSYILFIMIEHLKILEKFYGHPSKVAHELGISHRHYRRIKKEERASKTIKILIKELVSKFKIDEAA